MNHSRMDHTARPPMRNIVSASLLAEARTNVAARLHAKGRILSTDRIERCIDDECWDMRHEINRLRTLYELRAGERQNAQASDDAA